MDKARKIIANQNIIVILFSAFAIAASIQSLTTGPKKYEGVDKEYSKYNNYDIFKYSYYHLIEGKDLYQEYPNEHWDLFKYSPTFAASFGLLATLPDWLGLNLWNLLNALILLFAIYKLPRLSKYQKGLISILCLIELMTSLQNEQSNGLIAGLTILAFTTLEKRQYALAALFIVFSTFIKIYGIVAIVLFIFYPQKWKMALYSIMWFVILLFTPLLFVDISQLKFLYTSWANLLTTDYSASYGLSVMGWLQSWFSVSINKYLLVLLGATIFALPLAWIRRHKHYYFRLLTLVSILIWVVIFNHKAESPTFILAMSAVSIWFVVGKKNTLNVALFITAFIFTTLSSTDLFPAYIKFEFVQPYVLKAIPCIIIWIKVVYDMIVFEENQPIDSTPTVDIAN